MTELRRAEIAAGDGLHVGGGDRGDAVRPGLHLGQSVAGGERRADGVGERARAVLGIDDAGAHALLGAGEFFRRDALVDQVGDDLVEGRGKLLDGRVAARRAVEAEGRIADRARRRSRRRRQRRCPARRQAGGRGGWCCRRRECRRARQSASASPGLPVCSEGAR